MASPSCSVRTRAVTTDAATAGWIVWPGSRPAPTAAASSSSHPTLMLRPLRSRPDRPRRDAQQQAVDRHGLPGRIAPVPLYLEAVADRAEVERPERGAVLVQQRHVHRLERGRHEPCPERPVLDGDLRITRHYDGHGFRPQPHGLEHAGHLGRKYELVGAIPRIEYYEAPEHRDSGVPPPAKQLGGPQIHEPLSAPRDRRSGGGQLHDAPAQQHRGHIELEVLVCANPRHDETVP